MRTEGTLSPGHFKAQASTLWHHSTGLCCMLPWQMVRIKWPTLNLLGLQVTNPALDPFREKLVTSTRSMIGPEGDITDAPNPTQAARQANPQQALCSLPRPPHYTYRLGVHSQVMPGHSHARPCACFTS